MYGGSRGGVTALAMASNPKRYDYRVTLAAAVVPPARVGELSTLQSTTFPALLGGVSWTTGFGDAWRSGWTYPSCAGLAHLTGKTGPQAHLYILTGTTDPAYADAHYSLLGPDYLTALRTAGTKVHLEVGSHDAFGLYAHGVEYGLKLAAAGVPLEMEVLIRAGHASRPESAKPFVPAATNRIWEALQTYVEPALVGRALPHVPGVKFFRVNRSTRKLEAFVPSGAVYPFTLEGARYVAQGKRFPVVLVGAAGTAWQLTITPSGGGTPYSWTGTIGTQRKSLLWIDVPPGMPLGDYRYGLQIKKPGASTWQLIASNSTADGSTAFVTVVATEPNVSGLNIGGLVAAPTLAPFTATSWGLSEY
jgi:hypothetical protein